MSNMAKKVIDTVKKAVKPKKKAVEVVEVIEAEFTPAEAEVVDEFAKRHTGANPEFIYE